MIFDDYNPELHDGLDLYELISSIVDGVLETAYAKSNVSDDLARRAPWHYFVLVEVK